VRIIVFVCLMGICLIPLTPKELPMVSLWEDFIENDFNVSTTDSSYRSTLIRNRNRSVFNNPTLNISGSRNPGSKGLGLGTGIGMTGGLAVNGSINSVLSETGDDIKSIDLSVGVSQGLYPYWLQGEKKDPYLLDHEIAIDEHEIQRAISYRDLLSQFTNQIMQYRYLSRQIRYLDKSLEISRLDLLSYQELQEQGRVSENDIWEKEQKIWDDEITLLSYKEQYFQIESALENSTGKEALDPGSIVLPDHTTYIQFRKAYLGTGFFEMKQFEIENKKWSNSVIQRKQNNAPSLSANFSMPIYEVIGQDIEDSWNLSIALDFSVILSPERKREKQLEENEWELLGKKKENIINEEKKRKELLEKNIERLTKNLAVVKNYLEKAEKILENAVRLYDKGELSELNLRKNELSVLQKETLYQDIQDELWYHKFSLEWK